MRITRFRVFLLLGASFLMLGPAIGLGQPGGFPGGPPPGGPGGPGQWQGRQGGGRQGGGRQGGGRQGRRGGFQLDPNMIFSMLSKGQDYLTEADYLANPMAQRDPNAKDQIESFMQRNGIPNGQLTREQFAQFFQERMAQRQAERQARQGADGTPAPGSPAATDPNSDGGDEPVIEDKRPTVFRANNLPKQGLPPWFAQLDTDKDGQVGLYEWKQAGRSQSEFQTWDLNGDGFITVEEAMRTFKKTQGTNVAGAAPASGAPSFGQFQGGPSQGDGQSNGGGSRRRRNRGNPQNQGYGGN